MTFNLSGSIGVSVTIYVLFPGFWGPSTWIHTNEYGKHHAWPWTSKPRDFEHDLNFITLVPLKLEQRFLFFLRFLKPFNSNTHETTPYLLSVILDVMITWLQSWLIILLNWPFHTKSLGLMGVDYLNFLTQIDHTKSVLLAKISGGQNGSAYRTFESTTGRLPLIQFRPTTTLDRIDPFQKQTTIKAILCNTERQVSSVRWRFGPRGW